MLPELPWQEIDVELARLRTACEEAESFLSAKGVSEPSSIEITGAGGLIAQFYGGIERILVRICKVRGTTLPHGPRWHAELFKMFCTPPAEGIPALLDQDLEDRLRPFRGFRHVFVHGYGFALDWSKIKPGLEAMPGILEHFSNRLDSYR